MIVSLYVASFYWSMGYAQMFMFSKWEVYVSFTKWGVYVNSTYDMWEVYEYLTM